MTVALIALSWRSPESTERAMATWRRFSPDVVSQRLVWYQERTAADDDQAARHGFVPLGGAENVGIGEAYRASLSACTAEYAMFIECDWQLRSRAPNRHLRGAAALIGRGQADLVRLRSRFNPGWPLNTIPYRGQEEEHERYLLEACYWRLRPDRAFGHRIRRQRISGESWYVADASVGSWTNNPHLARTDFLRAVASRDGAGAPDFEPDVNSWWSHSGFVVAQGRGLFTHRRVDGPSLSTSVSKELVLTAKRVVPSAIYQRTRRR